MQGTGTADEMALEERTQLATEGIVVAAVEVTRPPAPSAAPDAAASEQVRIAAVAAKLLYGERKPLWHQEPSW